MTTAKAVCQHPEPSPMGYLQWHADADRRHKKGERQQRCPVCLKYVWQSMYYKLQVGK